MGMTLGVTGRRPRGLPWRYSEEDPRCLELKEEMRRVILCKVSEGYDTFVTGMAMGIDTYFAESVIDLRSTYPGLRLVCEVPFSTQSSRWTLGARFRYNTIKSKADEWNCPRESYDPSAYLERDARIVERSDSLLVVWDGVREGGTYRTYEMALRSGVPCIVIDVTGSPISAS